MQNSSDPIPPKTNTDEVSKGEMQLYELALQYMKDEKGVEVGAEKSAVKNMKSAMQDRWCNLARHQHLTAKFGHNKANTQGTGVQVYGVFGCDMYDGVLHKKE